jgi:protein SCO1/2
LTAASLCLSAETPPDSIYQFHAKLTTQTATTVGLDLYRGHPTLIGMFYGSCPAACPMLITAMQVYESHLDAPSQARLRVLLVSFDAARDTPAKLEALAHSHRADPARWTFASADDTDSRAIAALLGFSYRRLPNGDFDHSLLITLLDEEGRIVATTTTLVADEQFQAKLRAATQGDKGERHSGARRDARAIGPAPSPLPPPGSPGP